MKTDLGLKVTFGVLGGVTLALLTAAMLLTAGWTRPPVHVKQFGFRGLSLGQVFSPKTEAAIKAANVLPEPIDPAPATGKRASAEYKNVKVLGNLSVDQFNRVMVAITEWVSPDQGCAYCHNTENLADDSLYTKVVARRMLQMNLHVNHDWQKHVGETGVVCYTCHRGQPVPASTWFNDPGGRRAGGFAANNNGMGHPTRVNDSTTLPADPFTPYIEKNDLARVTGKTALPQGPGIGASIQTTEQTYSLMMHMSQALGVNCTYCHNSRAFSLWEQSSPARSIAYYGLQMVRDLNDNYLDPLEVSYPANRLGPHGDAPKVNCATCHQGAAKPLLGASIAKDYPELGGVPAAK